MSKTYIVNQDQFERLRFFQEMFRGNADILKDLCNSEKSDIEYGFALGQSYNILRTHYHDLTELLDEIKQTSPTGAEVGNE